ncbi:MAG: exonuclease domain-containing protein [Desulfobacterales bacterium]|jgi:DNA polymerase-3 subunit epsilon
MVIPLSELQVLALDCQATGANPQKGHLLEIGWVGTCAAKAFKPQNLHASSFLVALPEDAEIPAAVQRITGITKADSGQALSAAAIWQKLVQTARAIAAANQLDRCPTIIHYARFEKPFLKHLHPNKRHPDAFPLQIVCTHEIAKRLLPGLPRRGLRAVAGYFGYTVPPQRRSADHALGTAVIWKNFVEQLAAEQGITHLDQLTAWLKWTSPEKRINRVYPMSRELRLNLPHKPGIYRMLRSNGDLLYIGKATSLRQRVNSYFRQKGLHAEHTLEMLSQAVKLDVSQTGSALEAAVLESDEIKRHSPPYNVALQKGQRKLIFCSSDLQKCAVQPDKIHCIGPLPDGNLIAAMTAFGTWYKNGRIIAGDDLLNVAYGMLNAPQAHAPEPECLAKGLSLFRSHHQRRLKRACPLRFLTGLGRDLWHARLKALENARTEAEEQTDEESPADLSLESEEAPSWTPEAVARGIEKLAMRSALLIRRSRWLCLLSESSLAWEMRDSKEGSKIVLVLANGAICHRQQLLLAQKTPASPGYAKRMAQRQQMFDLSTYERLRVLTTEMRRLMAEGRQIEIRLNPTAVLGQKQLSGILPWV